MLSLYSAKRDNLCDNTGAISVESEDVYGNFKAMDWKQKALN
jgi:hypothetical protein